MKHDDVSSFEFRIGGYQADRPETMRIMRPARPPLHQNTLSKEFYRPQTSCGKFFRASGTLTRPDGRRPAHDGKAGVPKTNKPINSIERRGNSMFKCQTNT